MRIIKVALITVILRGMAVSAHCACCADAASIPSDTVATTVTAGSKMTLNDCILYGLENSQKVNKSRYAADNYKQDKTAAISDLIPSISASSSITASYGRSVDPGTNTYTTMGNLGNSYGAYASMTLFSGLQLINNVRLTSVMKLMGLDQLQQTKDELAISIIQAYFDVIYYNSTIKIGTEQLEASLKTLEQAKVMEEMGSKSPADVAQIETQVATERLFLVQQENKYKTSLLTLKQSINWPIEEELNLDLDYTKYVESSYLDEKGNSLLSPAIISSIVEYAIDNNPKIEASEKSLKASKLSLQIARGKYLPTISGQGGYNSSYYKTISGGTDSKADPFWTQLDHNKGHYFGASISIPIFSGLARRTNVHKAKNSYKTAMEDFSIATQELKTEITRTAFEVDGYIQEYNLAKAKADAAQLAYDATAQKFAMGSINPIDLQTSANQLLSAKAEELNAKLQLTVKSKLLDYYSGEPLVK